MDACSCVHVHCGDRAYRLLLAAMSSGRREMLPWQWRQSPGRGMRRKPSHDRFGSDSRWLRSIANDNPYARGCGMDTGRCPGSPDRIPGAGWHLLDQRLQEKNRTFVSKARLSHSRSAADHRFDVISMAQRPNPVAPALYTAYRRISCSRWSRRRCRTSRRYRCAPW